MTRVFLLFCMFLFSGCGLMMTVPSHEEKAQSIVDLSDLIDKKVRPSSKIYFNSRTLSSLLTNLLYSDAFCHKEGGNLSRVAYVHPVGPFYMSTYKGDKAKERIYMANNGFGIFECIKEDEQLWLVHIWHSDTWVVSEMVTGINVYSIFYTSTDQAVQSGAINQAILDDHESIKTAGEQRFADSLNVPKTAGQIVCSTDNSIAKVVSAQGDLLELELIGRIIGGHPHHFHIGLENPLYLAHLRSAKDVTLTVPSSEWGICTN